MPHSTFGSRSQRLRMALLPAAQVTLASSKADIDLQFGLTAFLHDGPSDALLAYKGWYRARRDRLRQAAEFYSQQAAPA